MAELAGNHAEENGDGTVADFDVWLACRNDEELDSLVGGVPHLELAGYRGFSCPVCPEDAPGFRAPARNKAAAPPPHFTDALSALRRVLAVCGSGGAGLGGNDTLRAIAAAGALLLPDVPDLLTGVGKDEKDPALCVLARALASHAAHSALVKAPLADGMV